jgi:hypothetical protein
MPSKLADRTDDERGDGSFGLTGPGDLESGNKDAYVDPDLP